MDRFAPLGGRSFAFGLIPWPFPGRLPLICFIFAINFYQVVIKFTAKQFTLSERLALEPAFRLTGKRSRASGVQPETVTCRVEERHPATEVTIFFQLYSASKRRGGVNV